MEKVHKEIIHSRFQELLNDLEPDHLMPFLFQNGILNKEHMAIIASEKTRKKQSQELLSVLERSGPRAFSMLIEGLQEEKSWLAKMLLEEGQYKQGE